MSRRTPDPLVLVKIAQKDFEAAKALFERELYPQAIYMLQQSLEKAAKAALLRLGLLTSEEELKKGIRHDVAKRTLEMLIEEWPGKAMTILVEAYLSKRVPEEMCKELTWKTVKNVAPFYETIQKEREEAFEIVNEIRKKAFKSSRRLKRKAKELMGKANSLPQTMALMLKDFLRDVVGGDGISSKREELLERLPKERVASFGRFESLSILAYLCLAAYLAGMLLFLLPFDDHKIEELRYRRQDINKEAVLVYWSLKVKELVEERELLRKVEELIEGKEISEQREVLNALLKAVEDDRALSPT